MAEKLVQKWNNNLNGDTYKIYKSESEREGEGGGEGGGLVEWKNKIRYNDSEYMMPKH